MFYYIVFFPAFSASEFMKFTSKTVVERSEPATRCSVKQQGFIFLFLRDTFLPSLYPTPSVSSTTAILLKF